MPEITWILEEAIIVTKRADGKYTIQERTPPHRQCVMGMVDGRMLFDGVDIETENFMAYVGLMDMMDGEPIGKPVTFDKEDL